jgi:hypothetical protein
MLANFTFAIRVLRKRRFASSYDTGGTFEAWQDEERRAPECGSAV